ncbi:hypothetical protein PHLGIDRAFT_31741 [Phlebiopsis gigantea 11061_1 CR5-6]|uniref:Pseudouridine synthase RsuA/RluA-like domain-containing protein n=1 Tax=Phlebiopsis gigantea (strain 11061_1 CR5-6) TaxID=745531 RepID=A0A0C3PDY8_PHLG1|nr:hypothetical protein PHLGIDRAFT_31741 [Phlebiopsis gigantea 11061_1 CR5-6]
MARPIAQAVAAVPKIEVTITKTGLRKISPYWYNYTTMAKGRWLGREILEVVSTEFRDRSMEYYRYALDSGVTTVNGDVAKPDTIIRNGDRIENIVHRHEPPVTAVPVRVIHHDKEREFVVVDKPGGMPVHAVGRYYHQTLIQILKTDFGFDKLYAVNRIDRPTSGLLIIPLSPKLANTLASEFISGGVQKEYVARCSGRFPEEEVICEQPLLTVDRQMGLNIVHPEGKHAKTIFNRLHYDPETDTSVLHSHQIRVHLQYLGHSIANDPIYSSVDIWGEDLGKGGVDIVPSDERAAPAPPPDFDFAEGDNPESLAIQSAAASGDASADGRKLLPRETGHDIGMGSPVPLSNQVVQVITNLRNQKDKDEDWGRWRDVVFRTKGKLTPLFNKPPPLPPQNRRKRGGPSTPEREAPLPTPPQLPVEEALEKATEYTEPNVDIEMFPGTDQPKYCPECYLPLYPDQKPEKLYIFLHALRYTTSLGRFETELPAWAAKGFKWDRD